MRNATGLIKIQLHQRCKEIERLRSDVVTIESLLSRSASDFAAIMDRIARQTLEMTARRRTTMSLLRKKDALQDLGFLYYRLFENLNVTKMREMALYYESSKCCSVHPWLAMSATHPELLTQIRYRHLLSARVNAADAQLRALARRRDQLAEKAAAMRTQAESALPKTTVIAHMEKYAEDLSYQEEMIRVMHDKIQTHRGLSARTATNCTGARLRLNERKEQVLALKRRTSDSQRAASPTPFCTQPPQLFIEEEVRSRPSPSHHRVVPPLPRDISHLSPDYFAPQSQRTRRPLLAEIRKKVTRPIQTGRK
jgi:hypothetical protein